MKKLLLLTLVAIISACGKDPLTEGFVVDKRFEAAHTSTELQPVYRTDYEYRCQSEYDYVSQTYRQNCGMQPVSRTDYVLMPVYHSDDYNIRIKFCPPDKDKCEFDWIDVSKEIYDSFKLGDYYKNGERIIR